MSWVDVAILGLVVIATFGGLAQGFFRSFCSLAGLVVGLAVAAWNYTRVAVLFKTFINVDAVSNTIAFLLIVIIVMGLASIIGGFLAKTIRWMGLGCLDKIAGAVFGFFQGALMVMLGILVTVAFFPQEHWLAEAKLPKMFFGACHLSSEMSPGELGDKVKDGLKLLQRDSPQWLHQKTGES
jgi:membrane protein required for colicin V production